MFTNDWWDFSVFLLLLGLLLWQLLAPFSLVQLHPLVAPVSGSLWKNKAEPYNNQLSIEIYLNWFGILVILGVSYDGKTSFRLLFEYRWLSKECHLCFKSLATCALGPTYKNFFSSLTKKMIRVAKLVPWLMVQQLKLFKYLKGHRGWYPPTKTLARS